MPSPTYRPRPDSVAMNILRHMQRHGQPMTSGQMRDEFGHATLNGAVRAGLLRREGRPAVFHPTPALAAAALDGEANAWFWGEQRTQLLKQRYPTTRNADLAILLGATLHAVQAKAAAMGLRKTPETIRRNLQQRNLSRPYTTTSPRTEHILRLMREGIADGCTGAQIGRLIGVRSTLVGNALRHAISSGVVQRKPINQRHYAYHLNRAHRAAARIDDGQPVQIIVPAGTPRAPVQTTAPNSVFAMGRATYPTTTTATP